jgi:hypothetical protein
LNGGKNFGALRIDRTEIVGIQCDNTKLVAHDTP